MVEEQTGKIQINNALSGRVLTLCEFWKSEDWNMLNCVAWSFVISCPFVTNVGWVS